jgi:hypothetical protein
MIPHLDAPPLEHGGDLAMARRLFPGAPQPFIDLSTGINPFPYPLPPIPAGVFARLPDAEAQTRLAEIAARTYGAPSAAHVTPAPGTQILLAQVAALVPAGQAAILGPTYSEHGGPPPLPDTRSRKQQISSSFTAPIWPSSPIQTIRMGALSQKTGCLRWRRI